MSGPVRKARAEAGLAQPVGRRGEPGAVDVLAGLRAKLGSKTISIWSDEHYAGKKPERHLGWSSRD
ncbi:hypothetical protein PtA15_12A477 [Puccinia triticina]|uniref:Uncharacterized protein n=1 Tax=Puccinia triticina TaxID=208348 RepID=A0ABY7D1B1_9BASI|nr:uncharacterized protein PtA15_12A477 [Puccinia triticina]WAQ90487.1 hypothetical protein PtA15_12A477 [Puccinia triticina]WAR61805.1 hypothetical protein PtB15_12B497 [Puccinia triticina]